MSNLSELLPTGGGQNAVDFVASGTLSSGQTVVLNSDGTVSAVESTSFTESLGSAVDFTSNISSLGDPSATFDSVNNKVILVYKDYNNNNFGTAIVGTVSGTSISFGTAVVFESANTTYTSCVFDPSTEKVVIAYRDGNNANAGTAIVGTVSGTSISFGTAATYTTNGSYTSLAFDSISNKVILFYRDNANSNYGTAAVCTVSGTSISFGSRTVFNSANVGDMSSAFHPNENRVVVGFRNSSDGYGKVNVGTISGTSISFSGASDFNSGSSEYVACIYDPSADKIVIGYRDTSNAAKGTAVVATLTGSSISFGSSVVFETGTTWYVVGTYSAASGQVVFVYQDDGNSGKGTLVTGTVSGTSISFDAPTVFSVNSANGYMVTYDSNEQRVVFGYYDVGTNDGDARVLRPAYTVTNSADFIGITASAIADTATGAVNVYGGINEAQTGLTIGSDYYVQADGSLSTTASSVKVGQAISATTINMMDLT